MLSLTSAAFKHEGLIPQEYTCDGARTKNPPVTISGVPVSAVSLVLICDDPDVPKQIKPDGVFDHWVLFNIPVATTTLAEGESAGVVGINGRGENGYSGPCPPTQYEPKEHRYFFRLYALDFMLPLGSNATKGEVLSALNGHVIEQAELMGRYARG